MKLSARLFLISSSVAAAAAAASLEKPASDKHAQIRKLQPQSCAEGYSSFVGSGVVPLVSLKAAVEYSAHVCFDESSGVAVGEFFDSPVSNEDSHVTYHVHCAARDGAGGIYFGAEIDYMSEAVLRVLSSSSSDDLDVSDTEERELKAKKAKTSQDKAEKKAKVKAEKKAKVKSQKSDDSAGATTKAPTTKAPVTQALVTQAPVTPVCGCDLCPEENCGGASPETQPQCFPTDCDGNELNCDCSCGGKNLQRELGVQFQHANGEASKTRELGESPQGTLAILYFGNTSDNDEEEEGKEVFGLRLFADYDHSCESFANQMKDIDMDEDVGPFVSGDFSIAGPMMN